LLTKYSSAVVGSREGRVESTGVSLSWMNGEIDGKRFLYHSGRTRIEFSTLCVAYPEDKVGIMILVNDNLSQDNISILRHD